jgi:hypothetical protein
VGASEDGVEGIAADVSATGVGGRGVARRYVGEGEHGILAQFAFADGDGVTGHFEFAFALAGDASPHTKWVFRHSPLTAAELQVDPNVAYRRPAIGETAPVEDHGLGAPPL